MGNYKNCRIADIPCLEINPPFNPIGTVLLPYHGERGELNYFDISVLQQHFWTEVLKAVKEAKTIASELLKIDNNLGVVGHSAG